MLTVELLDRDKTPVTTLVDLMPLRYSVDAVGGPVQATIAASGAASELGRLRAMLGYYVRIRNRNNTPVWWGMIEEVTTDIGGLSVGVNLNDFRNRMKVSYTVRDGDGYAVAATTAWEQHDQSVAIYGTREMVYTAGELSPDAADALRDRELSKRGLPRQSLKLAQPGDSATIRCVGLWSTLAWTYYVNTAGREVFDVQHNAEQTIGWGFTASDVGFADRRLHKLSGGLEGAGEGEKIIISGSTSNNGSFVTEATAEGEVTAYTNTTISFDPVDDILDSADGFGFVREGTFIDVDGSVGAAYDGYHLVDGRGRNHITVDETVTGAVDTLAAGASITVTQGQSLPFTTEVTTEIPGNTITVSSYKYIAYSFTLTDDNDWTVAEVWIRARKVGTPSDSLLVGIAADAGGSPSTLLDYGTVAASSLLQSSNWVSVPLANTVTLAYGTTYWVIAYRTGANDADDYYAVGVDEDLQRGAGTLKLYDGSSWVARPVDADMPFQVWGHTDTTTQIAAMLLSEGQFLAGNDVRTDSDLPRRQYRDGSVDTLYEVEKLIEAGSYGVALLATVNADWRAVVDTAPTDSGDIKAVLRSGPELVTPFGEPLEQGLLPVGVWCAVDGIDDGATGLAPLSPFLIGFLEYDATKNKIVDLRAYGDDGPFSVIGVGQG